MPMRGAAWAPMVKRVIHETARMQAPGLVEIWPMIAKEKTDGDEDWDRRL